MKNSGRGSFEKTTGTNLRQSRIFWERKNPLEMYDDVELYDFVVFIIVLTIVDELQNDLEYPERHATRLLAGCPASHGGIANVCDTVLSVHGG